MGTTLYMSPAAAISPPSPPPTKSARSLQQILANTQRIDRSLQDQRRVLNDAHKRISAMTKGLEKPTP
jgi:hypothetical protein